MATPIEAGRKIKVLLCKSDQDAHDRGVRYIAQVLRDAGMEVIFIRYRIADEVMSVVMQEDVDVLGLSFYSSGLMHDTSTMMRLLKERNLSHVAVIIGGIVPPRTTAALRELGVRGIFGPGDPEENIIDCIIASVRRTGHDSG